MKFSLLGKDPNKLARNISIALVAIRFLTNFKWWLIFPYAMFGGAFYWTLRAPLDVVTGQEYIRVWMNKEWKGIIIGTRMEKVHREEPDKYNYFVTASALGFLFFLYMMIHAV